jgi:hypothetical protein
MDYMLPFNFVLIVERLSIDFSYLGWKGRYRFVSPVFDGSHDESDEVIVNVFITLPYFLVDLVSCYLPLLC